MLKNLREMGWRALLPVALVCLLPSCGGGGGGDDVVDQGIRPSSLNGVTLNFGGATLNFTSPSPNTSGTGTEVGGIFYEQLNTTAVTFAPTDPAVLDAIELSWPFDLAGTTHYEYTPIDGSSARLLIFPESTEGGILDNSTPGNFDTIVLVFTASGDIITGIEAVYTVNSGGTRYSTNFTVGSTIGGLTGDPRPVPAGWNGVNTGPGFIADPSFEGQLLTLAEDGGDTEIQLGVFNPSGPVVTGSTSTTETGTVSITFTLGLLSPPPGIIEVFEADYTLIQPFGTEDVELQIVYRSGTTALPADETVTMSFTGGGILSPDVQVLYGNYVRSGGTFGTFILAAP